VFRRGLAALVLALLPGAARACAVCFGSMPPDLSKGFYWGILLLLLLPPVMILSFAGFIVYRVRKVRRAAPAQ
jgi:hypothetical protein